MVERARIPSSDPPRWTYVQRPKKAEAHERYGKVCSRADIGQDGQDSAASREVDEERDQYGVKQGHVRRHELKEKLLLVPLGPTDELLGGRLRRT
jgi:hypothetical protein